MSNELVIDVTSSEIVIALLEDKRLVELTKEKSNNQFTVGDIYLARVKKIMPGLNAAFIDVGYERDAFLHYLDLGPQFNTLAGLVKTIMREKHPPSLKKIKTYPDIDKNGKIKDVLEGGDRILVQVAKEPISTKGPRLTSEISIPGRNLVLIPFSKKISISKNINSTEERKRLKNLIQSIKPKNYGVIVRTAAREKKVAVLDSELRGLIEKWEKAVYRVRNANPPKLIIGELNRTTAILRDIFSSNFNHIYINDKAIYNELKDYISSIAPEKEKIVKYVNGKQSLFEHYGIDKQIKALFGKTVTMKTGAYLIIEHTEALHTIDVNSGNRSRKGVGQEENALQVNMLAAEEIARQLRLRDMGGIIVVDFIDMNDSENRKKVFEKMRDELSKDRTKSNILPLSKFGLMQITRQRVRPEMHVVTAEKCPTCGGTGQINPAILIPDQIENNLRYIVQTISRTNLTLKTHPYIAAYLNKGLWPIRFKWMIKYKRRIKIIPEKSYDLLNYKFFDKYNEEIIV